MMPSDYVSLRDIRDIKKAGSTPALSCFLYFFSNLAW